MIENILKNIGLKRKEIKIYLALLPLGSAPASVLGKQTNISRSTAHYTCKQLEQKGLVSSTFKKNTDYFNAEPPDKLQLIVDRKIKKLEVDKEELHRMSSNLMRLINPQAVLPKMRFYEGVDGLISLFNDELTLKEDEILYGAHRYFRDSPKELVDYFQNTYDKKREKQKYQSYSIRTNIPEAIERSKLDKVINRTSLFIPEKEFPFESSFQIYKNKIVFYSLQKSDLTGVLIENDHMKTTMLSLFRMAWNYAKTLKINKGFKNIPTL
ncbi:TrmB family transcriptional regulator [Patescibacteria group bacterium]